MKFIFFISIFLFSCSNNSKWNHTFEGNINSHYDTLTYIIEINIPERSITYVDSNIISSFEIIESSEKSIVIEEKWKSKKVHPFSTRIIITDLYDNGTYNLTYQGNENINSALGVVMKAIHFTDTIFFKITLFVIVLSLFLILIFIFKKIKKRT